MREVLFGKRPNPAKSDLGWNKDDSGSEYD